MLIRASNLIVNGQTIETVNSCKYLGIIIDDELKWNLHIENIYKTFMKYTSIFYKLRGKLPGQMLREINFAIHLSIHVFCMVLKYMLILSLLIDKLMKLINKLLRILQCVRELYKTYNRLHY